MKEIREGKVTENRVRYKNNSKLYEIHNVHFKKVMRPASNEKQNS
jgi:hypothetical protein